VLRKKIIEESLLLLEVIKWSVLATVIGMLVGGSTALFLRLIDLGSMHHISYMIALPLGGLVSGVLIFFLAPKAEGHGTEAVIREVHKSDGLIQPIIAPVKMIASVITIISGGSVGKEGPAAQIGCSIASTLAQVLRLSASSRKKLVICGISAGFSSIFGTPIAGAIFGMEVLFLGQMMYSVIFPSFVAGIVSFKTAEHLGVTYYHSGIAIADMFTRSMFMELLLAGVFFGIVTLLFIESLKLFSFLFKKLPVPHYVKPMVGGLLLALLVFAGLSSQNLGLGTDTIHSLLEGGDASSTLFITKAIATSITLGSGGSGGIITPLFFIGAASGHSFSGLTGLDSVLFSAIGMVAVLAAATNTPLACSVLAMEMFGPKVGLFAALSIIASYIVCGHRSVYASQILMMKKGDYFSSTEPREIGSVEHINPSLSKNFRDVLDLVPKMKK